ncbi:EfeM/EfeO family lipoprotein [Kocuria massiliensis]|uniref:EfeM/EfeO family lipoprotein n=1 Tax=Kocuria massiliensis TaxID=1926282 RepID=UPI0022B944EC|nr:EfeM/EfeO family lipoprotein [Kocuria massiliensis]
MRHRLASRWVVLTCIVLALALIGYGLAHTLGPAGQHAVQGTAEKSPTGDGTSAHPRRTRLEVGLDGCTHDWTDAGAGAQVFEVKNTSDRPMEVQLMGTDTKGSTGAHQDAQHAQIFAELEALGPGVTRDLTTSIGAGTYHFTCMPEDGPAVTGDDTDVPEPDPDLAASLPAPVEHAEAATEQEIIPYTQKYERWVKDQLPGIRTQTDQLAEVIQRRGPTWRQDAQHIWLSAHHDYMKLGAAYGAFGDRGDAIDGTAAGLEHGADDEEFTGFHRIEKGLWSDESPDDLLPLAQGLSSDISALGDDDLQVGALELGLRTHEISEDTATLTLSGKDDFGSHSGLDSARAQLEGTRELVDLQRLLLADRLPAGHLDAIYERLDRALDTIDEAASSHPDTAPADLPADVRGRVRSQVGQLSEQLAEVAAVTDIRRAT